MQVWLLRIGFVPSRVHNYYKRELILSPFTLYMDSWFREGVYHKPTCCQVTMYLPTCKYTCHFCTLSICTCPPHPITPHPQVVIIIAEVQQSSEGLEDAIFWGIRFSVIATAVNPLLYGILARQYRLAHWYVIKLVLSKFCRCVSPPLKDVFGECDMYVYAHKITLHLGILCGRIPQWLMV